MRKLGQLMVTAMIAILLIPTTITMILGNNKQIAIYSPVAVTEEASKEQARKEQASKEKEKQSQEQLIGIVAKEIPIHYEEEALKAQVIMARSYMASASSKERPYMSTDELRKLWGSDYNRNYAIIQKAVEETKNMIITYNKEPVQPVYHMQSAGITQTPMDIWDLDVPYLESVESKWDEAAPDLIQEKSYNAQSLVDKVNQTYDAEVMQAYSLETQIQIIERTHGGYVKSIQIGNELMSGDDFRKLLDLRSSCFKIEYDTNEIKIITKGAGHGVGLSQYGANQMAKEGKTVEEILNYYFPKTTIELQK